MSKIITFAAAAALLCCGSFVIAAETSTSVTCKDHTKDHAGKDACSHHGGVQKAKSAATPIDTTKGFTADNKALSANDKTPTKQASNTKHKSATHATNYPTARCNDGAQYFSKKRPGACMSHGGVKTWYE
jgi:hypothetical protein